MRASRRRSHHSCGLVGTGAVARPVERSSTIPLVSFASSFAGPSQPPVKFPRRIEPLASKRSRAFSISPAEIPSKPLRAVAVTGPRYPIQPVTMARTASSFSETVCRASAGMVSNAASGKIITNTFARSVATQYCLPSRKALTARPVPASLSKKDCHPGPASPMWARTSTSGRASPSSPTLDAESRSAGRAWTPVPTWPECEDKSEIGNAINVCNTSCNSSASRTSGQASSLTCSIAAGSSLPTSSRTDSGRIRRISTARARRSSSGASSRYAYGFAFRISCENCDGTGVSTAMQRMRPSSMRRKSSFTPSMSMASVRTSFITSFTRG